MLCLIENTLIFLKRNKNFETQGYLCSKIFFA